MGSHSDQESVGYPMIKQWDQIWDLIPSGKRLHNYGKPPFLMGKLTISMAIFNSYVKLPEGNICFMMGSVVKIYDMLGFYDGMK